MKTMDGGKNAHMASTTEPGVEGGEEYFTTLFTSKPIDCALRRQVTLFIAITASGGVAEI